MFNNHYRPLLQYIDKGGRDPGEIKRIAYNCYLSEFKEIAMGYGESVLTADNCWELMDVLDSMEPH